RPSAKAGVELNATPDGLSDHCWPPVARDSAYIVPLPEPTYTLPETISGVVRLPPGFTFHWSPPPAAPDAYATAWPVDDVNTTLPLATAGDVPENEPAPGAIVQSTTPVVASIA